MVVRQKGAAALFSVNDDHDREQLARLRVAAASGHLPRDVGAWALDVLEAALASERAEARDTAARDECLRRAGALAGGSTWARARALRDAIVGGSGALPPVRMLVAQAQEHDPAHPLPKSVRQLFRLLAS